VDVFVSKFGINALGILFAVNGCGRYRRRFKLCRIVSGLGQGTDRCGIDYSELKQTQRHNQYQRTATLQKLQQQLRLHQGEKGEDSTERKKLYTAPKTPSQKPM
jgi:hypothetical protein